MASVAAKKVRIQDVKPYDAPSNLDELCGPGTGAVSLPPWVYWGPDSTFDLKSPGNTVAAYQAVIQEGRVVDQVQILNRDILIAMWPKLTMPARVRHLWEGRFPELVPEQ